MSANGQNGELIGMGIPASAGFRVGEALVITRPLLEWPKMRILVGRNTSPDYMEGIMNSIAVVTEVGGLLSHAAVVARELRIPSVVQLPNATKMIRTGDIISVNGSTGEVRRLTLHDAGGD